MKKYQQLSLRERRRIHALLDTGISVSVIAQRLCRNRSTIYREVRRNSDGKFYLPYYAQQQYVKKRCRKASKIKATPCWVLSSLIRWLNGVFMV